MAEQDPFENENKPEEKLQEGTQSENTAQQESEQRIEIFAPARKPIVTFVLIGISVVVFLAQLLTENLLGTDIPLVLGAKYGPLIDEGQWWRLFTPTFLHGSITHIFFNMYALFSIGPELERYYGHVDFLLFYLIAGFTGNVATYLISPDTVSVGASTALFGLIAAQGFFIYRNSKFMRDYRKSIRSTFLIVAINLVLGLQPGIDNWGHLGGLAGGAIMSFLSSPQLGIQPDIDKQALFFYDTTTKKSRYLAYGLCFALFAAMAFALS